MLKFEKRQWFVKVFDVFHFENLNYAIFSNNNYYERIEEKKGIKLADWKIETENLIIFVEQKTSLATINSKTLYPDIQEMKSFFDKIAEGFVQLESTEKYFKETLDSQKKLVKILVLFETIYTSGVLTKSIIKSTELEIDILPIIVDSLDFEVLIHLLSDDPVTFESIILEKLHLDSINYQEGREIHQLLERNNIKQTGYAKDVLKTFIEIFGNN